MPAPTRRDGVRWWLARHRRPLAAGCAALAVWTGLSAARHRPEAGRAVLVASHDLAPGAVLGAGDVRTVRLPAAVAPPSALAPGAAVTGRGLAVAVPAGVPLTAASFSVGAVLPAGTVATSVRLADPASAALLHPGDHVDVLAATGSDGPAGGAPSATVVAGGVPVLSVPAPDPDAGDQGGLVVVAATPAQATALARAATEARLSVTVRGS